MLNDFLRLNFEVFLTLLQVFLQRLFFCEELLHIFKNDERFIGRGFGLQGLLNCRGDKAILGVIQEVGAFLNVLIEIVEGGFKRRTYFLQTVFPFLQSLNLIREKSVLHQIERQDTAAPLKGRLAALRFRLCQNINLPDDVRTFRLNHFEILADLPPGGIEVLIGLVGVENRESLH